MIGKAYFLLASLALCSSAGAQTQFDLTETAGRDFIAADAKLNRVYGLLLAKVSPAGKDALRTAQRAWLAFRDSECAFETLGSTGGSIHPMVEAQCRTQLSLARTTQLDAQLRCEEGDASCGGQ